MNRRKKSKKKEISSEDKLLEQQSKQLAKDIGRMIKGASKEIDRIRKNFPDMPNPLKKTARRKEKK